MLEQFLTWDRNATLFINGSENLYWDQVIYVATSTWMWIPMGVVMLWLLWRNMTPRQFCFAVLFLALAIFISDQLSSTVFKPVFQRWRPTRDPVYMYFVDVVHNYRGGMYGFFSAHASNTLSVAVFLACLIRNKALNVVIISWSLLNCYTRLYLGVHYLGDVLVGICFGLVIGLTLAYFYRKYIGVKDPLLKDNSVHLFSCTIIGSYCLTFIVAAVAFL